MKKIISLALLLLIICALFLTSCGSSVDEEEDLGNAITLYLRRL